MAKEKKPQENKEKIAENKNEQPQPAPEKENVTSSSSAPQTELAQEQKQEQKTQIQKAAKQPPKKTEAVARVLNAPLSKKHCMYICSFIKNKPIDTAIANLKQVLTFKKAVPFKGEIPHRKGMMSGRYPIKAAQHFITILKGLKGNTVANGLDLEKTRIFFASASWDSRPARRSGTRFKRTYIILKAKEFSLPEINQDKAQLKQETKK